MQVLITGKNIDIGDALRQHIESRLNGQVEKYFDGAVRAHVTVEKQKSTFQTECTLHLSTGLTLQAHDQGGDAYASFDGAAAHLEKRLRRYKSRLKDHHQARKTPIQEMPATDYVIAASDDKQDETAGDDANPTIIAESVTSISELSVGEAAMKLDISNVPAMIFRNIKTGTLSVVYRRGDGHIGWIDPDTATGRGAA